MSAQFFRRHRPDYLIIIVTVLLMLIGLVVIYAVSPALAERINATDPGSSLDHNHFMYRQLGYLGIGILAFIGTTFAPLNLWRRWRLQLMWIAVGLSILLIILPSGLTISVNGATRWFDLGFVSFQPAEVFKFALAIFMAGFLASRIKEGKESSWSDTLVPLLIILAGISLFVVIAQKDMGTMLAIMAIFLTSLFISGIEIRKIFMILGGLVAVGILLIVTFPHRMERVMTLLGGGEQGGSGYHIEQALIAVGSGGFSGRGLGQSIQAFGYLPEAANDSIFAIFAEKFGFIGVLIIIALFGFLFIRILRVMENAPTKYMQLLVAGVFGWLVAHTIVNIGAMIGILPLTGITLPFLSFGGTSLLFIMAALGLVVNVSRFTIHQLVNKEERPNADSSSRRRVRGARHPSARYS